MSRGVFHYEQRRLENDLVALEIFDPESQSAHFVEIINKHPSISKYVPFPELKTEADFKREVYDDLESSLEYCLYAIIDKTSISGESKKDGNFAGILSLNATSRTNAATEIGVIVFPLFQRTHVASNAIGLALQYALDPPSAGGLGLRRVEWRCDSGNAVSRKIATRMGFELEGVLRWQRVITLNMVGGLPVEALEKKNGTTGEARGRHTAIFSIVWDEWDEKRDLVTAQMKPRN